MNELYRFFKSVRLAVVLILVITVLSLLATLVPQGREPAFYQERYSVFVSGIIRITRFDNFFSSALFLIPTVFFTVNLAVCAVDRFVRRVRAKAKRRYGPDIIHIGLLVMIAAGLVTGFGRQEKDFTMAAGEEVALKQVYTIKLLSFEYQKYESGAPKAWISTVSVVRDGKTEIDSFPIEVNHPLRLPRVSIYQTTWVNEATLELEDGSLGTMQTGDYFQDGDTFWIFADIVDDGNVQKALFQEFRGHQVVGVRRVAPAETIGPYTVSQVRLLTGLRAVNDPGFIPVIAAAILIAGGLALTFIQKKREEST